VRVADFDFALPEELIALRPVVPRDAARLLIVREGEHTFEESAVRDLPSYLEAGDVCVFNDTRVIPAQLSGLRPARGPSAEARIDVTLHKRETADAWAAFAKPGRKLAVGDIVLFGETLSAQVSAKGETGEVHLRFNAEGPELDRAIASVGVTPLPPYIAGRRAADARDETDYQTIYATHEGAVAAPTAGLHFTPELMATLDERGVKRAQVTLHVGAGTFLPVKADDTADHVMHAEWGDVPPATANAVNDARRAGKHVAAIGTTSLRILESASDDHLHAFRGDTRIFITPGYRFKSVDTLLTNFHLPRSTLFMLVSAFCGLETMRAAYAHAIANRFRFYSYGDACLLLRNAK
jgi:S-adenosylmethionine:tRNA ribosyltransferase-isomerase